MSNKDLQRVTNCVSDIGQVASRHSPPAVLTSHRKSELPFSAHSNSESMTTNGKRSQTASLDATKWKLQLCTGQAIFTETAASRRAHVSCPRNQ